MPATATAARPISCPEYEKTALAVGWPRKEIPRLTYVMARESSCFLRAWNRADPFSGSYGATQINGSWKLTLKKAGLIREEMTELFNLKKNLKAAKWIFDRSGWAPWGFTKKGIKNEYPRRQTVAHSRIVS